jgi:hypothetical protein
MRFFTLLATVTAVPAVLLWLRFIIEYATGAGHGHVQSLVLSTGLFGIASLFILAGIMSDLMAANRLLLEDIRTMMILRELSENAQCGKDSEALSTGDIMRPEQG